ncbi:UDP-glucose 4-epimerase GalE [Helicobacter sp. 11S02629-2]|uniref:UDP-glucose 4-epimerase GalE n=1 Tax=Helicobacter sp. 11S02629-2 TaxID=1476195 RepID=UPI000BA6881D|nr:UDP-glucose 4-epimerase GalE [Helicobacter sp. 11S02629-2]PAF44627.1 UDP-glucose 4-epimerase GalE [Helicobacter sp. 11S02629-2]
MTLLITGACGYIGSHTAMAFLKNTDCKVVVVDNLVTGFIDNYKTLRELFGSRVTFVESNFDAANDVFSTYDIDCVIHFAASISVEESVKSPLKYYMNNTAATSMLLDMCVRHGVKKFIFSSTAAVYGEPQDVPVKEDSPLLPINPYGNSKKMIEEILKDVSKAHDFNYVALRYFNVASAYSGNNYNNIALGQRTKNATHLIKVACECAVGKREGMSIYGDSYATKDGTCIRDYIHVDDLADAHITAFNMLNDNKGVNAAYNAGYGHGFSVKQVIDCVKKVSHTDFKVDIAPPRAGDPAVLIADNSKLKSMGWKARHDDLEQIILGAYLWEKYLLVQDTKVTL